MRSSIVRGLVGAALLLGCTGWLPSQEAASKSSPAGEARPPDAGAQPPTVTPPTVTPPTRPPVVNLPPLGARPQVTAPTPTAPNPAAAPVRISDPQALAIVETYLKAIGGREKLAKITDRTTKFRNLKHAPTGVTVANINLLLKDAICIREEWDIEGFSIKDEKLAFTQIYNGVTEEGWVQMLGTVSALDGRTLQVFVWDKQMDDFFCHWQEDGYTITMGGQGILPKEILGDETPCDIVNVSDFSGRQQQKFFFSKKDGLVYKKEWLDTGTTPRTSVKKEQYYKMYRDLAFMDGSGISIKFPLRLEIYVDGDLDTERIYTNVLFNSGLSPKLFDKPAGKPFVAAPPGGEKPAGDTVTPADPKAEGSAPKAKAKKATGHPPIKAAGSGPDASKKAEESKAPAPPVQDPAK